MSKIGRRQGKEDWKARLIPVNSSLILKRMSSTSHHSTPHVFHLQVALRGLAASSETGAVLWRARHHPVGPTDLNGGRTGSIACGVGRLGRTQVNHQLGGDTFTLLLITANFPHVDCCNSIIHLVKNEADAGLFMKSFFGQEGGERGHFYLAPASITLVMFPLSIKCIWFPVGGVGRMEIWQPSGGQEGSSHKHHFHWCAWKWTKKWRCWCN